MLMLSILIVVILEFRMKGFNLCFYTPHVPVLGCQDRLNRPFEHHDFASDSRDTARPAAAPREPRKECRAVGTGHNLKNWDSAVALNTSLKDSKKEVSEQKARDWRYPLH